MRITQPPVGIMSEITIDTDLDMQGLYQVKRLALPGVGEALRKGYSEIINADIAHGADIVYTKLYLTGKILAADIVAAAGIPYSKLNLALSIMNADIAAAALIAYSKMEGLPPLSEAALQTELKEDLLGALELGLLAHFQSVAATGDFNANPEQINDNNEASDAIATAEEQYAEVLFSTPAPVHQNIPCIVRRWRQYGDGFNNEDGSWKIEYWDLLTNAWLDWVTGIVTRNASTWSNFVTETTIITTKIRLVCTAVDTAGAGESGIGELEVVY